MSEVQLLLEILLKLVDLACWLCSKRDRLQTRLETERYLGQRKRNGA